MAQARPARESPRTALRADSLKSSQFIVTFPPCQALYAWHAANMEKLVIDEGRFDKIWREHGPSILRYCRFATGNTEAGEDAASETFARFLQKGESVPDDRVEAWLFTVARNLCMTHHRQERRRNLLFHRIVSTAPTIEGPLEGAEVLSLLADLNERDRLAVYLRVVEDRPFREVACLLGLSEHATKKRVYRALSRLHRLMNRGQTITKVVPDTTPNECLGGVDDV